VASCSSAGQLILAKIKGVSNTEKVSDLDVELVKEISYIARHLQFADSLKVCLIASNDLLNELQIFSVPELTVV